MVSHYLVRFGGHKPYDRGGIMLLVVENQDSICWLKSALIIYS